MELVLQISPSPIYYMVVTNNSQNSLLRKTYLFESCIPILENRIYLYIFAAFITSPLVSGRIKSHYEFPRQMELYSLSIWGGNVLLVPHVANSIEIWTLASMERD